MACADATRPRSTNTYRIESPVTRSTFLVQIENPTTVDTAESLRQSGQQRWVTGTVRRGNGGFNAPWHWHLDPATLAFAEVTVEACQATPEDVEQRLDYWIGFPGGQVCLGGVVVSRAE